jgi:hypothetical protein
MRLLAALTCTILLAAAVSANATGPPAHAARTLNVKDEAKLHFVRSSASTILDEGNATGTIPGAIKITFTYTGSPNVSAQFTISGARGSIKVRASGKLSSPTNPKPSFKGGLTVTGGSGRYAHAHGAGALYGVFYRRSYAILVQAQGAIHY